MKEQRTIFKSAWKLGGWDAWRRLRADEELIKILTSIVKTSQKNLKLKNQNSNMYYQ